jgi:tRNA (cmo5U34)-methyltransferase
MTIDQAFNATVEYYDDWIKKALPNYGDIFGTAIDLIPFDAIAQIDVLDLGSGTGLFSKHVLDKYPHANFVLYDVADKMLRVAQERFRLQHLQFKYVVGNYRTLKAAQEFDLVISSLSIHHLMDGEKIELFRTIHQLLRKTGVFINIDQVRGETTYLRDLYWSHWLTQVKRVEPSEERIRESINRRTTYDRDALLVDQLQWLKEAGFVNVDCVYKNYFVGVFFACKM